MYIIETDPIDGHVESPISFYVYYILNLADAMQAIDKKQHYKY